MIVRAWKVRDRMGRSGWPRGPVRNLPFRVKELFDEKEYSCEDV